METIQPTARTSAVVATGRGEVPDAGARSGAPGATADPAAASADAATAAAAAADHAGVTLAELVDGPGFVAGSAVLATVWGTSLAESPMASDLLASLAHAGSCVLGAYSRGDLVGLTVGVAGSPGSREVYSLIAAILPGVAGRGVGAALKFGQRAWSLDRGAERMVWTFDPLVRRNAHFNLSKLGARAAEYRPDFYPPMHDAINREDLTDRLVAEWDLRNPLAGPVDAAGSVELLGFDEAQRPVRRATGGSRRVRVRVPRDIELLRRSEPGLAREWRLAVREALCPRLSNGYRIEGFSRDGAYILEIAADD